MFESEKRKFIFFFSPKITYKDILYMWRRQRQQNIFDSLTYH